MTLPNSKRLYRFSDADHAQIVDAMLIAARRDSVNLAAYGVTPLWLDSIEAANDLFKDCSPDEYWAGDMINATYNKNAKRDELLVATRQITERARIRFGSENGILSRFAVSGLSHQTDNDLVRTGRNVAKNATNYATELLEEGVTAPMVAAYLALIVEFDELIDIQKEKIQDRDTAVEDRIAKGNALYALLTKLSARGKLCWQDSSEARYNDYVIYTSSQQQQSIIEGVVESGVVVNTSVNDATAATVITMKNTGNVPISFFYALNPTDITGPMPRTVLPNEEISETAANLGLSAQLTRFNVYNDTPTGGSYRIEW